MPVFSIDFQIVMLNSFIPDSVMLNSYLMLYHIPLYLLPLYLIQDFSIECYDRLLFFLIPDSVCLIPLYLISVSFKSVSVIPDSTIPDSCLTCYNRFRNTRLPACTFNVYKVARALLLDNRSYI